jgi:predicted negative regulator of RcsB-dependent stress response
VNQPFIVASARRCLFLSVLVACAGSLLAADLAPAQIFKLNDKGVRTEAGAFATAFVAKETIDEIDFVVDDPNSPNHLTLKRGSYQVEYGDPANIDFMRGRNADEAGDVAKAFETYGKAAATARLDWVKQLALYRAAQSALTLKKFDDALGFVATLEKDSPRSQWLDDALLIRGQAQAAKGDNAGAAKTYATLTGMAAEWGEAAAIFGARGQAGIAAANKQPGEAAALLSSLVARVGKSAQAEDLAPLVLELAENQRAAGKPDDAIASLQGILYRDMSGSLQARAHHLQARILAEKGGTAALLQAFDQAAIAGALKGADPATLTANRQLAIGIVDKLGKDPAVSAADKAEYKRSLSTF